MSCVFFYGLTSGFCFVSHDTALLSPRYSFPAVETPVLILPSTLVSGQSHAQTRTLNPQAWKRPDPGIRLGPSRRDEI